MSLVDRTAAELLADLNSKRVSSVEVTQAFIDQIEKHDGRVKAFLRYDAPAALKQAKALEMVALTNAMKQVTAKYAKAIALAETVRAQELEVGNNAVQGRYNDAELVKVEAVLSKNRKKVTTVTANILKKSIDKV